MLGKLKMQCDELFDVVYLKKPLDDYQGALLDMIGQMRGEIAQLEAAQHRVEPTFESAVIASAKKHSRKMYRPV